MQPASPRWEGGNRLHADNLCPLRKGKNAPGGHVAAGAGESY